MATNHERLSFLDSSFLALESRTTHMHVGAITLFEPFSEDASGAVDIDLVRRFIEARLHLVPRYRQRLAYIPVERAPVWIDDEHFSIDYHVRHTSLPRPGTSEQLDRLAGRIMSQQLDRQKPLWELWIVEGLDNGGFALISKVHHCMIDGMAGVDLMAVLLNLSPTSEVSEPEPFEPRPAPSDAELIVGETARLARRVVDAARNVRHLSESAEGLMEGARMRAKAASQALTSGWLTPASRTPFTQPISPNRRFGRLSLPLDRAKAIKNALGGTVNDVVLATVAGGVRHFFKEVREFDVSGLDFRVMAPVSVARKRGPRVSGNQVAMWLMHLPVDEPDPVQRLEVVRNETAHLKTTNQALGATTLVQISSGAPITMVSMAARLATGARPFNMTVTNVPGPQFPLYLLKSKMLATYPLVPLWMNQGVGIALFSYDGSLDWGFNADWDLLPDLDRFIESIEVAFAELEATAAAAV